MCYRSADAELITDWLQFGSLAGCLPGASRAAVIYIAGLLNIMTCFVHTPSLCGHHNWWCTHVLTQQLYLLSVAHFMW